MGSSGCGPLTPRRGRVCGSSPEPRSCWTSTWTRRSIGSHSEKEGAAGNFKGGYGFHPMLAYADADW